MKICKVRGCNNKVHAKNYCNKHYHQIYHFGEIRSRTNRSKNYIKTIGDICYMGLYSTKNEKIATTKFNKKHRDLVLNHKWHNHGTGYVKATIDGKKVSLHRFIKGSSGKLDIDHTDIDRLNNLDNNLRFVTRSENILNNNRKCYWFRKKDNRWWVTLTFDKKQKYFGRYKTEAEAKKVANIERKKRYKKVFGKKLSTIPLNLPNIT